VIPSLLFVLFASRLIKLDQPIAENDVGRQIPTAMVARHLARGGPFWKPELDTGPFPNYFLVEPPIYAQIVAWVHQGTRIPLEQAGRLVSAFGVVLAGWGLSGIVRKRLGFGPAWVSLVVYGSLPVVIRYGRAFQPDALHAGLLWAAMRVWDVCEERESPARYGHLLGATVLTALALALKVISGFWLGVIVWGIRPRPRRWAALGLAASVIPAIAWYGFAIEVARAQESSTAAADNFAIWWRTIGTMVDMRALRTAALGFARACTPIWLLLGVAGLVGVARRERFFAAAGAATLASVCVFLAKYHHEYYWLVPAPAIAALAAWSLTTIAGRFGRTAALGLALVGIGYAVFATRGSFETPPEWLNLAEAKRAMQSVAAAPVVAKEAVLYYSERRGCRLEMTDPAARRAAFEWRNAARPWDGPERVDSVENLIEFYREQGARYFLDVIPATGAVGDQKELHATIRKHYRMILDSDRVFLAALGDDGPRK
jgi:hypothetical protein